jgi:hypothetical protein
MGVFVLSFGFFFFVLLSGWEMGNFVILDINIIRKKRFIYALHVLVHSGGHVIWAVCAVSLYGQT